MIMMAIINKNKIKPTNARTKADQDSVVGVAIHDGFQSPGFAPR
jgi:hypothetical protein